VSKSCISKCVAEEFSNITSNRCFASPRQVAILWESDSGDEVRRVTYRELFSEVCRLANVLRGMGKRFEV
jgi:acyl-coenzyme A synthetase/AMP-(fatty) acid ligase